MQTVTFWQPWMLWIALAVIAGIIEIVLPYFTFIFICASAIIAAVCSLWFSGSVQIGVFSVMAVALVVVLRPWLAKRFHVSHHHIKSRSQRFHDAKAEVTETIDPVKGSGRISVGGEDWAARADHVIAIGTTVQITDSDGIVLLVKEF